MERAKEREEAWSVEGASEGKWAAAKASEENKENLLVNSELQDDLLLYQDEEVLNDSIISGERGPAGPAPTRSCHGAPSLSLRWRSCHSPGGQGGVCACEDEGSPSKDEQGGTDGLRHRDVSELGLFR